MKRPPVTSTEAPVMYPLSSDAKNATTSATSSGSPKYPIGIISVILSTTFCGTFCVMGVAMNPGRTELQRIPCLWEGEWLLILEKAECWSLLQTPQVLPSTLKHLTNRPSSRAAVWVSPITPALDAT